MTEHGAGRHDMRRLPLGLRRYLGGDFERLHRCGCGVLSASYVSALYGQNRFTGKYALACHIAGKHALDDAGSDLTDWGKRIERLVIDWVAETKGWQQVEQVKAYARHPQFDRLIASPDAVAWREDKEGPGVGEIKTLWHGSYKTRWQELDEPPLDVQLQVQTQLACTGARWGFVAGLDMRTGKPFFYEVEPLPAVHAAILEAARNLFALLDADKLPEPDDHATSIAALHKIYPSVEPDKIVLLDTNEARTRFDEWQQAKLDADKAEVTEKACKHWFMMQDPLAQEFRIGNSRTVGVKVVDMPARQQKAIPASSHRRWTLKENGE